MNNTNKPSIYIVGLAIGVPLLLGIAWCKAQPGATDPPVQPLTEHQMAVEHINRSSEYAIARDLQMAKLEALRAREHCGPEDTLIRDMAEDVLRRRN